MAFCAITDPQLEQFTAIVVKRIKSDINKLKDLKTFSKEIFSLLTSKNAVQEKAISLVKEIPDVISFYRSFSKENRDSFRLNKISADAIDELEGAHFRDYDNLAQFLDINDSSEIQLVSEKQQTVLKKLENLIPKVEINNQRQRVINGATYETRVSRIIQSGFPYDDEQEETPALKHGNTVDAIAKQVFDNVIPKYSDVVEINGQKQKINTLVTEQGFNSLLARLFESKKQLEDKGFVFKTGITVWDEATKVSGEIDLLAIDKEGNKYVFDFKTTNSRLSDNSYNKKFVLNGITLLSKDEQYSTQGYIYSLLLSKMLGEEVKPNTTIIGISIIYDTSDISKPFDNVTDVKLREISSNKVRTEFKNKSFEEILQESNKLNTKEKEELPELIKPKRERKSATIKTERKKLDRISLANEKAATIPELQTEIAHVNQMFGDETFIKLLDVVDANLLGQFRVDGITLFQNATKGTAYHEGWHRFSQLLLTKADKTDLYNLVKKEAIEFTTRDGRTLNTKDAAFLDVEEFLAEEFAKYAQNPTIYSFPKNAEIKTIFQKILDFLKYLVGKPSAFDYFQQLYNGETKQYTPSVNNAFWGKLNSVITNSQGEEIISNERLPLYEEMVSHLVDSELQKDKKSYTAFKQSKSLQKQVRDNIFHVFNERLNSSDNQNENKEEYLNDQQFQEFDNIVANFDDFFRVYLKNTQIESLKNFEIEDSVFTSSVDELTAIERIKEENEDLEDFDDTEENDSKPERFDRAGNEDNAYSIADKAVKDFFNSISKLTENKDGKLVFVKNELGYPKRHTTYDVFYRTKKLLEGAFTIDEVLNRMTDANNIRLFPELTIIHQRFAELLDNTEETNKYRRIQNEIFIQSFTHSMELMHINNMQLTINYNSLTNKKLGTVSSFKKLSRNLSLKIIKNWSKVFKDRRGKVSVDVYKDSMFEIFENNKKNIIYVNNTGRVLWNPFLNYGELFKSNNPKGLIEFFNQFGIKLNTKVYQDPKAVELLANTKNDLIAIFTLYKNKALDDFTVAIKDVAKKNKIVIQKELFNTLNDFDSSMMDEILSKSFLDDPINYFSEKRTISDEKNVLRETRPMRYKYEEISSYEEEYGDLISSGSFNIEGKTKYPFYIPNQIMLTVNGINQVENSSHFNSEPSLSAINPLMHSWMKRTIFYNGMFEFKKDGVIERKKDKDGNHISILIEDMSSFKTIKGKEVTEVATSNLSKSDKLLFDILAFLNGGAIEVRRAETSPSMFSLRLSTYDGRKNIIPATSLLTFDNNEFLNAVKQALAIQLEVANWYKNNEPDFVYDTKINASNTLGKFEDILGKELADKIINSSKRNKVDDLLEELNKEINEKIVGYFEEEYKRLEPLLKSLSDDQKSVISDALQSGRSSKVDEAVSTAQTVVTTTSVSRALRALIANRFLVQTEYENLIIGDPLHYKNMDKRGKAGTNTKTPMVIDPIRNQRLNALQGQTLHSIITGKQQAPFKDFSLLKSGVIADPVLQSSYIHKDDDKNIMLQDLINFHTWTGEITQENKIEFIKSLKKEVTNSYEKIEIADGQGIISLDFYRNFMISMGGNNWTEAHEKEYERQLAIFRHHFTLYFSGIDNKGNKILLEGDALTQAQQRDEEIINSVTGAFLNPLKISYTGPDGKAGPLSPVFDKFSVRPILPEAAIGTRDENLLKKMAEEQYDYLKFKSGTKSYKHPSFNWFKKLEEGVYDLKDFSLKIDAPVQTLYSKYLGHQLNTEGIKKESIFGSQFRKIVYDVMYTSPVLNNSVAQKYFETKFDEFINLTQEAIKIEEKELFTILGIETKPDGSYYVADFKSFVKYLREEATKRNLPINAINYIQYNPNNSSEIIHPLDFAFNRSQITDLLSGLMDSRLRRLKLNGSPLIQVSTAGFEKQESLFKNPTTEQIKQYGTNGLHYYHLLYDENGNPIGTSTMGVKVSLTKNFKPLLKLKHPDGKRIGTDNQTQSLSRLNEALKDATWKKEHMQKLIMVGYRIPTGNNNFIDRMEIMEFLPFSSGAIIIPPPEAMVKSGSDFDIDKMNILMPSLDKKTGAMHLRPKETIDEIDRQIKQITFDVNNFESAQKEFKSLKKALKLEIPQLINLQRKVRNTIAQAIIYEQSANLVESIEENSVNNKDATDLEELQSQLEEKGTYNDEIDSLISSTPNLNTSIQNFYILDKQIERLKEEYDVNEKVIDKNFELLMNKKIQIKSSISNEIVQNLADVISSIEYYPLLVSPSNQNIPNTIANKIMSAKQNIPYDPNENLWDAPKTAESQARYSEALDTFDNLLGKRKNVGGYAIQRTWSSIFNQIKFTINKYFTDDKGRETTVYTPLLPKSKRTEKIKDGRIKMYGDSVENTPIRNSFDQLQSSTLDLANSPSYPNLGVNKYNELIYHYLIHQGVDPEVATFFINQPILELVYQRFEKQSKNIIGYTLKHALVEIAREKGVLNSTHITQYNIPKYTIGNVDPIYKYEKVWDEEEEKEVYKNDRTQANQMLAKPGYDANEYLSENDEFLIGDLDKELRENKTTSAFQKKVLAYFISANEQADSVRKLQFAYNTDTTKYSTLPVIVRNENNKRDVKKNPLFTVNQIEKIENHSMIAPFDYTQKAKRILEAIYPTLYSRDVVDTLSILISQVRGRNLQVEKFSKILENDYIEFVYKNFGEYKGQNLTDMFLPKIVNLENTKDFENESMSGKLQSILDEFPELNSIPFVNGLQEEAYSPSDDKQKQGFEYKGQILDNLEHRNINLIRSSENPTMEKDQHTDNWQNLIHFNPEKFGLKEEYSPEQISKISEFFTDLIYFSLYQSGLSNNGNGFSDLIPYQYWTQFVTNAFSKLDQFTAKNDSAFFELLAAFTQRAVEMNPRITWSFNKNDNIPFYRNAYKGKFFKVGDAELKFLSGLDDNTKTKESRIQDFIKLRFGNLQGEELANAMLEDKKEMFEDTIKLFIELNPNLSKKELNKGIEEIKDSYNYTSVNNQEKPIVEVGRYVKYKQETFIVTKQTANGMWQIYNPNKEGAQSKKNVSIKSIMPQIEKAKIVGYDGGNYIITPKNTIISLSTNKIMMWDEKHPIRQGILNSTLPPFTTEIDNGGLNPTC